MPRILLAAVAALLLLPAAAPAAPLPVGELRASPAALERIQDRWVGRLLRAHAPGTYAPLRVDLADEDLRDLGLPPRRLLLGRRFARPTAWRDGRLVPAVRRSEPPKVVHAGVGFTGIRPGGLLLVVTGTTVSWCSFGHVFGEPGRYRISTAGHCAPAGTPATVVGVVGRSDVPVLMDIGRFTQSTGDAGIGRDWAMIGIDAPYQPFVTPTTAGWGGPFGVFTRQGEVVSPSGAIDPDPALAQAVVHYGHGTALGGPGVGTPRAGVATTWRSSHFMFFGAITPGDSGSAVNTLAGDPVGSQRQAAGLATHVRVDAALTQGAGVIAGTRTTLLGAPAQGQFLPYPAPARILPSDLR